MGSIGGVIGTGMYFRTCAPLLYQSNRKSRIVFGNGGCAAVRGTSRYASSLVNCRSLYVNYIYTGLLLGYTVMGTICYSVMVLVSFPFAILVLNGADIDFTWRNDRISATSWRTYKAS